MKGGIELEADPRHAELVVKELEIHDAKPSDVPGAKGNSKTVSAKADEQSSRGRYVGGHKGQK